jgi:ribonuclease P protein component
MRHGRRGAVRAFVVLVAPTSQPDGPLRARLGITVSRRVGPAVVRNRVKRRVREWFRNEREAFELGLDVVVIGRRPAADLPAEETAAALREAAERAGTSAS